MKTAVITGASRGIGQSIALALCDCCDYIAICSKNSAEMLEETKKLITATGCKCKAFTGDVSSYEFVKAMIDSVAEETGSVDILINNAGISVVGLLTDTTCEMWQEIFATNVTSVFNTCKVSIPHMLKTHSGKIINISSVWGQKGAACEVAYSATKGAVDSFTKALAKELAPSNITVNAVAFGAIDTEMNHHLNAEEKEFLCEEIPYGRMATPAEAGMFVRKLLDMPEYFTGEVVKFDGAWI